MRHPFVSEQCQPRLGIPYALHGDDAGVFNKEKVLIFSMHGILPKKFLRLQHLLIFVVGYHDIVTGITLWQYYQVIQWSCHWLYLGKHPTHDHAGRPWPPGSRREALAGTWLTSLHERGVFCQGEGDWKFVKETFLWNAYGHNACCHLCSASKVDRNNWYSNGVMVREFHTACLSRIPTVGQRAGVEWGRVGQSSAARGSSRAD